MIGDGMYLRVQSPRMDNFYPLPEYTTTATLRNTIQSDQNYAEAVAELSNTDAAGFFQVYQGGQLIRNNIVKRAMGADQDPLRTTPTNPVAQMPPLPPQTAAKPRSRQSGRRRPQPSANGQHQDIILDLDAINGAPLVEGERMSAVEQIQVLMEEHLDKAARLGELAKVADQLPYGSPAEHALWELVMSEKK